MPDALEVVAAPRRQEILRLIWVRERRVGDIADRVDVSVSAVSQHLAKLRSAGAVRVRKEGRQRYYCADRAALGPLADYLEAQWQMRLNRLKTVVEKENDDESDS